tara:strand:- start:350 stop:565 length:216 start_codon:yes stop_codon:yes gene_type:complete
MKLSRVKLIVLEQLEYSGNCSEKHLKICETIKLDVLRLLEEEQLITRCSGLISITQKGLNVFSFFSRINKL